MDTVHQGLLMSGSQCRLYVLRSQLRILMNPQTCQATRLSSAATYYWRITFDRALLFVWHPNTRRGHSCHIIGNMWCVNQAKLHLQNGTYYLFIPDPNFIHCMLQINQLLQSAHVRRPLFQLQFNPTFAFVFGTVSLCQNYYAFTLFNISA